MYAVVTCCSVIVHFYEHHGEASAEYLCYLCHFAQVCTYDRTGLGFSKRLMHNETTGTEKIWGMSTTGRCVNRLPITLRALTSVKNTQGNTYFKRDSETMYVNSEVI